MADEQCGWWTATPHDGPDDLFHAATWATRAEVLTARLVAASDVLDEARLATAFVTGAAVLAHIRSDPLLPAELAPLEPGKELRAAYRIYEAAFSEAVTRWFRAH